MARYQLFSKTFWGSHVARVVDDVELTSYSGAIRRTIHQEMERDPRVVVLGIDVGRGGGVFGVTRGLREAFGEERVIDTPISEMGFTGLAVGASIAGLRPIIEIMYIDFIGMCLDALLNQAAKIPFMSNDVLRVPLVVRTQFGGGRSAGPQHSQSLEAVLAHIPGLKVVMPSTPVDAAALLSASIREDNPVVFIEHRHLYAIRDHVPSDVTPAEIGRARITRAGSDVTLVSYSRMLHLAEAAAAKLADDHDIAAEVIDLRTISPLDVDTVAESVERTNRMLVVHEAVEPFGVGAELVAQIAQKCFHLLDAPPERLAAPFQSIPFAPALESRFFPDVDGIASATKELCDY